jgi:hypothetical protein
MLVLQSILLPEEIYLPFTHPYKSQNQKRNTSAAAQQPAFQAMPHQQAKAKCSQAAAMQMIFPAHKKHPLLILCRGCSQYFINRQDKLS